MGLVALWHVESSQTRDWTRVPCIDRQIPIHCTTREVFIPVYFLENQIRAFSKSCAWIFPLYLLRMNYCINHTQSLEEKVCNFLQQSFSYGDHIPLRIVKCTWKSWPLKFEASLVAQMVKNPPAVWETWVWSLGWGDPLEKGMATHSSILAWRIPWTQEPGKVQSMGSQRVRHDWTTNTFTFKFEKCWCGDRTGVRRGKTGIRKTNLEPVSIVTHKVKRTWTKVIQKRKKWMQ